MDVSGANKTIKVPRIVEFTPSQLSLRMRAPAFEKKHIDIISSQSQFRIRHKRYL